MKIVDEVGQIVIEYNNLSLTEQQKLFKDLFLIVSNINKAHRKITQVEPFIYKQLNTKYLYIEF